MEESGVADWRVEVRFSGLLGLKISGFWWSWMRGLGRRLARRCDQAAAMLSWPRAVGRGREQGRRGLHREETERRAEEGRWQREVDEAGARTTKNEAEGGSRD